MTWALMLRSSCSAVAVEDCPENQDLGLRRNPLGDLQVSGVSPGWHKVGLERTVVSSSL